MLPIMFTAGAVLSGMAAVVILALIVILLFVFAPVFSMTVTAGIVVWVLWGPWYALAAAAVSLVVMRFLCAYRKTYGAFNWMLSLLLCSLGFYFAAGFFPLPELREWMVLAVMTAALVPTIVAVAACEENYRQGKAPVFVDLVAGLMHGAALTFLVWIWLGGAYTAPMGRKELLILFAGTGAAAFVCCRLSKGAKVHVPVLDQVAQGIAEKKAAALPGETEQK